MHRSSTDAARARLADGARRANARAHKSDEASVAKTRARGPISAVVLGVCVTVGSLAVGGCAERSLHEESLVGVSDYQPTSGGSEPWEGELADVPTAVGARLTMVRIRIALRPYGTWSQHGEYGSVWFPSETVTGPGFVPYLTAGHWVSTDQGMYWASSLPFGWVTFHYGRWIAYEGRWGWVPGARFAPAWVDWRVNDQYAGWAPLPPEGEPLVAPYAFCPHGSLTIANVYSVAVIGAPAASLYGTSRPIAPRPGYGGAVYAWGPTPVARAASLGAPGAVPSGPIATPAPAAPSRVGPLGVNPPPPMSVPLASAWSSETRPAPRAGAPVGDPSGARAPDPDRERPRYGLSGPTLSGDAREHASVTPLPPRDTDNDSSGDSPADLDPSSGSYPRPSRGFRDYEPVMARPRISETVRISDPNEPIYDAPASAVRSGYEPPRVAPITAPPAPPSWSRSAAPWSAPVAPIAAWRGPAPSYTPPSMPPHSAPAYTPPPATSFGMGRPAPAVVQNAAAYTPPSVTPVHRPAGAVAVPVGAFRGPTFAPATFSGPVNPAVQNLGFGGRRIP